MHGGKEHVPHGFERVGQVGRKRRQKRQKRIGHGPRKVRKLEAQVCRRLGKHMGHGLGGVLREQRERFVDAAHNVGKEKRRLDHRAFARHNAIQAEPRGDGEKQAEERRVAQVEREREDVDAVQEVEGARDGAAGANERHKEPRVRPVRREPPQRLAGRLDEQEQAEPFGHREHQRQVHEQISPHG